MPDSDTIYDLAVIGAGSAAKAAATHARQLGKSVVMIERDQPGGTCLNVGCIPSKLLLAAAAAQATAQSVAFTGLKTTAAPVDLAALVEDKDRFLALLRQRDHVDGTAEAGITLLRGTASFIPVTAGELPTLTVAGADSDKLEITAQQVLIATGAEPFVPAIAGLGGVDYLTSSTAMSLERVPESVLVVGGNAIGLEQAQLFSRLGSKVTVVEMASRIAPFEDSTISAVLQHALSAEGMVFHTGSSVTNVRPTRNGVLATVATGDGTLDLEAEKLLIATGRRPVTDGLGLAAVGVRTGSSGEIIADEHLRTTHSRIWAAGDVTGHRQFVYVAGAQGVTAANNALGDTLRTLDYTTVPRVTFTSPALASVGLTAAQAKELGVPCEIRELSLAKVPRAMVSRTTAGVVELVSDPVTGRLLGVHMVGADAGEVITAATYALTAGFTVQQLATTWAPFLTMAESLKLAAQVPPVRDERA
ncbi:mercury(II) reductase [Rhodococcus pyridinivorans]|uniref:mercury(II) reductase n=1 Tax=Rhodococcus pyridinivorans TaxID=103816 RepID=UPI0020784FB0|nr:mercury(II) reductase [Rhodococcus pyridinivorans]USI93089.1 mercury(II) reductase [Rhodococcus pyridinivorans]